MRALASDTQSVIHWTFTVVILDNSWAYKVVHGALHRHFYTTSGARYCLSSFGERRLAKVQKAQRRFKGIQHVPKAH